MPEPRPPGPRLHHRPGRREAHPGDGVTGPPGAHPITLPARTSLASRQLRCAVTAGGRPLRTFYIFDFERAAVLLIGGDKTGDERFYDRMIPIAERIWEQYKRERGSK